MALAPLIQAMRDAARPTVIQRQVIFDAGFGDTLAAADRLNLSRAASIAEIEAILQQMMARDQDKLTYEIGVVRADNGDFHLYKGKASTPSTPAQAPIPKDIFDGNANAVVTHNHPGGDPLSRGDVLLAVGRNAQEVRAVGGLGVYAFKRRTPGWGPVDNMAVFSAYSEGGAALWRATCPENDKQLRYRLAVIEQVGGNMPNQTFENDFTLEKHFACKMLAQQFPAVVEYSHPDEAQIIADRKALYEQRNPDARDKRAGLGHNQDLAGQGT